jgi:periplasmic protein TonB
VSYADQKRTQKPGSMVAALAVNGAIIAAIMLSPMVIEKAEEPFRTRGTIITTPLPPPPPPKDPIEKQTAETPSTDPIYVPKTPFDPIVNKNPIQTTQDPPEREQPMFNGKGEETIIPEVRPKPMDPPPPIFKRASRDPKFAGSFQPQYPSGLLVRQIEGTATLRVLVGTDGRVREALVVSATHPDFGKAAQRQALRAWRFKPATRGGQPVEDWVTLPVTFVIT